MPKVPYPYEVNGKLVTGNGSLIPICSLLPSLTLHIQERVVFNAYNGTSLIIGINSNNTRKSLYLDIQN